MERSGKKALALRAEKKKKLSISAAFGRIEVVSGEWLVHPCGHFSWILKEERYGQ
jgi:hypothetical protein